MDGTVTSWALLDIHILPIIIINMPARGERVSNLTALEYD